MNTSPDPEAPEALDRSLSSPEAADAAVAPLLALAREVTVALRPPGPAASYVASSKIRLIRQATPRPAPRVRQAPVRPLRLAWRFALASMFLAVATLGTGLGVAQASEDAVPGDLLYGAKRGLEQVQLALTFDDQAEASLRVRLATRRLEETEALLTAGRADEAEPLLGEYRAQLEAVQLWASSNPVPETLHGLDRAMAAHQQILERIRSRAAAAGDVALESAVEDAKHSQEVLEILSQGGSPSELAPGQRDRDERGAPRGGSRGQDKDRSNRGRGQDNPRRDRTPTPTP